MKDRRKILRPNEVPSLGETQELNSAADDFRCSGEDSGEKMFSASLSSDEIDDQRRSPIDMELMEKISEDYFEEKCRLDEEVRWRLWENVSPLTCSRNNLNSELRAHMVYDANDSKSCGEIEANLSTSQKSRITDSFIHSQSGDRYFCTKLFDLILVWYNVFLHAIVKWRGESPEPLLRAQMKECYFISSMCRKPRTSPVSAIRPVGWPVICLLVLLQCCVAGAAPQCDVYASGLDRAGREVGAEYVRCLAGRLVWKYPRNGLRLLIQSPQEGREFRGCIKADAEFDGAQVLVEGRSSLVPLLKTHDHLPLQRERCFSSYEGQAALYLEAAPLPNDEQLSANTAAFQYDLELLPPGTYYTPDQECRPCTDDELLEAACASDIVATGRLMSVEVESETKAGSFDGSDNSIEAATLSTIDSSFLTPSPWSSLGRGPSPIPPSSRSVLRFAASKITRELTGGGDAVFQKVRGGGSVATIDVPSHCGMRAGPGTYLLMARMRMGSPKIKCIPRLTYFEALAQKRKSDLQCLMKL